MNRYTDGNNKAKGKIYAQQERLIYHYYGVKKEKPEGRDARRNRQYKNKNGEVAYDYAQAWTGCVVNSDFLITDGKIIMLKPRYTGHAYSREGWLAHVRPAKILKGITEEFAQTYFLNAVEQHEEGCAQRKHTKSFWSPPYKRVQWSQLYINGVTSIPCGFYQAKRFYHHQLGRVVIESNSYNLARVCTGFNWVTWQTPERPVIGWRDEVPVALMMPISSSRSFEGSKKGRDFNKNLA